MKPLIRSRVRLIFLFLPALCVALPLAWWQLHSAPPTSPRTSVPASPSNYGQVPLSFEANHGQAQEPVKFLARGTNATLYLTPTEAALEVHRKPEQNETAQQTALVKMKLLGAHANAKLQGQQELPGKSNYFTGKDTSQWKTNIPTYQQVKYEQVYDGIDLVYYGNQQQLEYDFIVQPGADLKAIKFSFEGSEKVALNGQGELVLQTAAGEIKQHKPVIYQEVNGVRREIAGQYVMQDDQQIGFAVSDYDATKPLVIDPIISWASYVGGQSSASASTITADKSGNVYLVVWDGPNPTMGAYDSGGGYSVLKVNPSGTAVLWTARIGASSFDRAHGIALDKDNNVYLTGAAASSGYPTTPGALKTAFGITCNSCRQAFVTKLSADGSQLLYSTFVGGIVGYQSNPGASNGVGITVDGQGQAHITGATSFVDFPTTPGAFQPQLKLPPRNKPAQDAFVTKLNTTGTGLIYSTYLGDPGNGDEGKAIAVDAQGNVFVTGRTGNGFDDGNPRIDPFPTTPGAYVTTDTGSASSYFFLTKLNPTATTLVYSTIIGALASSTATICLKIDAVGNAYMAGTITSPTFPTTPGAYSRAFSPDPNEYFQAFLTKVNATGSALVYSTLLGGNGSEGIAGLSIDSEGNATVVGGTSSTDFPQTDMPQPMPHPMGFLTRFNSTGSKLLYSTLYLGASFIGMSEAGTGSYYLLGAGRNEFTPTPGAFQSSLSYNIVIKVSVPGEATTVSAANYSGSPLASESIVSAFGTGLATTVQGAFSLPLPTTLGGTTVSVKDSAGTERDAVLFYVSPTQVNFQIPSGTANGAATITIRNSDGAFFNSAVEIANVAPSIFSADATGRGLAAAQVQRSGSATYEPVVTFDSTRGQLVAIPIDLGAASQEVYLVMYGTGLRLRSNLNAVTAKIGGVDAQVTYAGTQNGFVGLDQVNILIPRSLIGRGLVDVSLNVDGKAANTVKVSIK